MRLFLIPFEVPEPFAWTMDFKLISTLRSILRKFYLNKQLLCIYYLPRNFLKSVLDPFI